MVADLALFFACYDYGQGGLWMCIRAASAEAILRQYPELSVFPTRPGWMTPDRATKLASEAVDLDAAPNLILSEILENRRRGDL